VKATSRGVASTPTANFMSSSGAAIATMPNKAELAARAVKPRACWSGLSSCGAGGGMGVAVDGPSPLDLEDLGGLERFVGFRLRWEGLAWVGVRELWWWEGRWVSHRGGFLQACCAHGIERD
jgi:hypothetical protein